jgi:hypothetical protein
MILCLLRKSSQNRASLMLLPSNQMGWLTSGDCLFFATVLHLLFQTFQPLLQRGDGSVLQEHIHRHQFDIKSNRMFSLLVGMGIVCSLSIWGNIELWKSKRQYADDALKFRVIRSWGGCNANHILWLNDVFDIHRNEETIEWIRQEADGYDKGLKTLSDSLMQEKLKVTRMKNNNNQK